MVFFLDETENSIVLCLWYSLVMIEIVFVGIMVCYDHFPGIHTCVVDSGTCKWVGAYDCVLPRKVFVQF